MTTRVLLLGGTGEARRLASVLVGDGGWEVLYSLAGRVREPRVPASCRVRVGGFGGPEGLAAVLRDEQTDILVDATHPFAARMSASAATAAVAAGTPLVLLRRPGWLAQPNDDWRRVPSMTAAAQLVDDTGADRVFLTTGRGDLAAFAGLGRPWFLIRCVEEPAAPLPLRREIILDRGPFDVEAEWTLLRRHAIDVVVTKDSGGTMTAAKLTAARQLGVPIIVVDRPPTPPGAAVVGSVEETLVWLRRWRRP